MNDGIQQTYHTCPIDFTKSSYYTKRIEKWSILTVIYINWFPRDWVAIFMATTFLKNPQYSDFTCSSIFMPYSVDWIHKKLWIIVPS